MAEELKKLMKIRTGGKEEPICIFIKIREAKDVHDLQIKEVDTGITELRVHSTNEKMPKWYTHGYLIDLKNLRLNFKDIKDKKQIQDVLLNPSTVVNQPTKKLLLTCDKDFGGIAPDGRDKLLWRTENFKKKKDPFKVKRKTVTM